MEISAVERNMAAQVLAATTTRTWKGKTVLVSFISGDPDGVFKALSHNWFGPQRARHQVLRQQLSAFMVRLCLQLSPLSLSLSLSAPKRHRQ